MIQSFHKEGMIMYDNEIYSNTDSERYTTYQTNGAANNTDK